MTMLIKTRIYASRSCLTAKLLPMTSILISDNPVHISFRVSVKLNCTVLHYKTFQIPVKLWFLQVIQQNKF